MAEAILDPSLLRSSTNLSRAIAGLLVFLEIRRARPIRFPSLPVASRVSIGVRMRKVRQALSAASSQRFKWSKAWGSKGDFLQWEKLLRIGD